MHKSYQQLAKLYDAIHQRRDYVKESNFVTNQIRKLNPKAKSIIDIGCGTGTHLKILSSSFSILAGVDISKEMLKLAKKKAPSTAYHQALMTNFHLHRKFDSIISLYSVFNYNLTIEDAEATLKNMSNHLVSGGVLIIALYYAKNTEKRVTTHTGKDKNVEVAKVNNYNYDPKTKMETSNFVLFWKMGKGNVNFTTENDHKLRIFEPYEIAKLLKKTGFFVPKFYDNYTNKPSNKKSSYLVLVTRKI